MRGTPASPALPTPLPYVPRAMLSSKMCAKWVSEGLAGDGFGEPRSMSAPAKCPQEEGYGDSEQVSHGKERSKAGRGAPGPQEKSKTSF